MFLHKGTNSKINPPRENSLNLFMAGDTASSLKPHGLVPNSPDRGEEGRCPWVSLNYRRKVIFI